MTSTDKKKIIEYIIPSVTAGLIFLMILFIKGMWPFGPSTIDYYDMGQQAVPYYYHNHDELFGLKSFVFDWYTNLGRVIPGLSEPSLFDLLFYIVPRDMILESMSLLMMFKIMVMALTMNLFITYINGRLPFTYRVMISAGYGLCGFVLINYTIPQWIDMASIVPLVLLFSQKALKEGRFAGLAVTIFLIMIDDYYFTLQALMFVFLIGGAYIATGRLFRKGEEKLYVTRLLAGVAIGLGISSFSWVPDIAYNLTSARFSIGSDEDGILEAYMSLLDSVQPSYLSRWFSLLGIAFCAALTVCGIIICIRKKRFATVIFCLVCLFMVTSQLFVESIHLILHFGSYVDYPVRNGFMIYCVFAGIAAGLYEGRGNEDDIRSHRMILLGAQILVPVIFAYAFSAWYSGHAGISDHTIFLISAGIMALCFAQDVFLVSYRGGRYGKYCFCMWAAQLLIFGIIMIGKPIYDSGYADDPEQEGEYIRITRQLVSGFGDRLPVGDDAATLRIKNPDTSLNSNYGMIMRRETLSGWTGLATADQITGAVAFGYSNQFTRMLDSGGTIFSDALMHITDVVSRQEQDDRLYEKIASLPVVTDHMTGETAEYHLYKNRFVMPYAIPVVDSTKLIDPDIDIVRFINSYAYAIGADRDIAAYVIQKPATSNEKGHETYSCEIRTDGKKTLYLKGNCMDKDYYNTRISVNGRAVKIPGIKEYDNELFPAHFNNNTVELGSFEDETASVFIDMDVSDPEMKFEYSIFAIDTEALADLCHKLSAVNETVSLGRRSIDISIDGNPGSYEGVLVPVSYNDGWSAVSDGDAVKIRDVSGLFMYVPAAGRNIHMTYFPVFMKTGIIISAVFAVAFAALVLASRKKEPAVCTADTLLSYVYILSFAAVFAIIYLIPVISAAIHLI